MGMARGGARRLDAEHLNYSMFSHGDLLNVILQRSEILWDVPNPGRLIRAWQSGEPKALEELVQERGTELAARAVAQIRLEFEALLPVLGAVSPRYLADIGCGYAFFDLFAHRDFDCDLLLVDVEDNDRRHFGYHDEAAAYASLDIARAFLEGNGVPMDRIATWNPQNEEASGERKIDLAVSLLSCGFHYPVDMYLPFFRYGLTRNGAVILDLRAAKFKSSVNALRRLGRVEEVSRGRDRVRVILRKGRQK